MRPNGKGEGGFMESMLAVMIVVISLTAFLSFLAFSTSHEHEKEADIPADILNGVRIAGGNIEADIEDGMTSTIARYGYKGMKVILSTADPLFDSSLTITEGSCDSDVIRSRGGTIIVRSDEGRSVPVNYSMAVWL